MTSLATADGVALAARTWLPAEDAEPRATIVLAHGFAAGKDELKVVAVAERLRAHGLAVVSYDARGHGASGGVCTLGDQERHDVAAAVAFARQTIGVNPLILLGASMGAIAVLRYAAVDPTIAGVVTVSSPAHWRMPRTARAVFAAGLTRTNVGRRLAARRLQVRIAAEWTNPDTPSQLIARLQMPTAVIHGANDRFIPVSAAGALCAAAVGPCKLVIVPRMGHAFDAVGLPVIADAVDWVVKQVQVAPTTTPAPPAPAPYGQPSPD